jgi:hypothetical protein
MQMAVHRWYERVKYRPAQSSRSAFLELNICQGIYTIHWNEIGTEV